MEATYRLRRMSVAKTRKLRRIGCRRGGGGGGNNTFEGKRLGPKAQGMKTMKNLKKHMKTAQKEKRAAERGRIIEQRRRSDIVGQNVEGLLANATNRENAYKNLTDDPEYLDQILSSFCNFLEELRELEEEAERDGDSDLISSIGIQKLQIAEVLLNSFGKKKNTGNGATVGANKTANNFGANLANILAGIKL